MAEVTTYTAKKSKTVPGPGRRNDPNGRKIEKWSGARGSFIYYLKMEFSKEDLGTCGEDRTSTRQEGKMKEMQAQIAKM